jgi:hypothetical protein
VLEDAPAQKITATGETLKNAFDRLTRKEAA